MDKTLEMSLLFDFFGDLLTDKQRECFRSYYEDDLSLSEIAEIAGISRQGVRDMLVRTEATLREFETKTGVVARFCDMQSRLAALEEKATAIAEKTDDDTVRSLAGEICAGLRELTE